MALEMGVHNGMHEAGYWRFLRACRSNPRAWSTTGDEAAAVTAIREAAKTVGEMRTMKLEFEKRKFVGAIYTSPIAKPEASVKQIHTEEKLDHGLALLRAALSCNTGFQRSWPIYRYHGQVRKLGGPASSTELLIEFFPHLEVLVCPAHDANHAAKYCLLDLLVPTNSSMWIRVLYMYVAVFGSRFTGTGSSLTVLSRPRPPPVPPRQRNGRVATSPSRLSVQYDETRTERYEMLNFIL